MSEQLVREFLNRADVVGTEAFKIAVKGAFVDGFINLAAGVLVSVLVYLMCTKGWAGAKKIEEADKYAPPFIARGILCLAIFMVGILAVLALRDGVLGIFVPEWQVIKTLFGADGK